MSIINNVLKDIDQQQKKYQEESISLATPAQQQKSIKSWFFIISVVVIIALIVSVYLIKGYESELTVLSLVQQPVKQQNEKVIPVITSPIEAKPIKTIDDPTPPVLVKKQGQEGEQKPINHINSFHVNELANGIELVFKLDKEPVNYVKSYKQGSYVHHLDQVESLVKVNELNQYKWLDAVRFERSEQGMDVVLHAKPNTLLTSKWIITDKQATTWHISITQKESLAKAAIIKPQPVLVKQSLVQKQEQNLPPKAPQTIAEKTEIKPKVEPVKLKIKAKTQKVTLEQKLQLARTAVKQQDWTVAASLLDTLLLTKLDYPARKQLIQVYSKTSNNRLEKSLLTEGLNLYPNDTELSYLAAKMAYKQSDYQTSRHYLRSISEHTAHTQALLGKSAQRLGLHGEAITAFQASLQLQENSSIWVSLALSFEQTKRYKSAVKAYTHAINTQTLSAKLQQFSKTRLQQLNKMNQ